MDTIRIQVVTEQGEGIEGVQVARPNASQAPLYITNRDGFFDLPKSFSAWEELVFIHISHEEVTWKVRDIRATKKITLKSYSYSIPAAVVSFVDTVYASEDFHVADFAFINQQQTLLLTYNHEEYFKSHSDAKYDLFKECRLVLLDSSMTAIDSLPLIGSYTGLYKHCTGSMYLESKDQAWEIVLSDHQGMSTKPVDAAQYINTLKRQHLVSDDLQVVSNDVIGYPAFDYYLKYLKEDSTSALYSYIDSETMEFLRSEFKYLDPRSKLEAYRAELTSGIDKEIMAAYMTGFMHKQYYDAPNCPLFGTDDGYMIFDHYKDSLLFLQANGLSVGGVAIDYHTNRAYGRWSGEVYKDLAQDSFYTRHTKAGRTYIRQISEETGHGEDPVKLAFPFINRVEVKDGQAFYTYRPVGTDQKYYLYKEELR